MQKRHLAEERLVAKAAAFSSRASGELWCCAESMTPHFLCHQSWRDDSHVALTVPWRPKGHCSRADGVCQERRHTQDGGAGTGAAGPLEW